MSSDGRDVEIRASRRVIRTLFVGLSVVALHAVPARAADCVFPAASVVTGVMLRTTPSTASVPLGKLTPGNNLPFVASVPSWYEVRLTGGQSAFVSMRWTDLAACPGAPSPAGPAPVAASAVIYALHAIDVGTGLSLVVTGPDFTLLYDAGSNDDTARGNANRAIAYLNTLSPPPSSIDHLILSHPHRDHVELLADIVARYTPRDVWNTGAYNDICGYRHFLEAIAAAPVIHYHTATQNFGDEPVDFGEKSCYGAAEPAHQITLKHGSRIDHNPITLGQGSALTFLQADGSPKSNFNENSLVARLDLGSHGVLLLGDAEAGGRNSPSTAPAADSSEGKLLACCLSALKADVLVVGHHGSKTSSRKAFLDTVGAVLFVVSAGPTKYASVVLPDAEIISELTSRGQVFRTDLNDAQCAISAAKVGADDDGQPGGCDNVLVTLPDGGDISAQYRRLAD
jgi:beta-lactamase superfamily II metal-dependent hydrolase